MAIILIAPVTTRTKNGYPAEVTGIDLTDPYCLRGTINTYGAGLRNLKSGNFEFACSRILAFPFDVGLGLGDPIVVDLDQHGADKSD